MRKILTLLTFTLLAFGANALLNLRANAQSTFKPNSDNEWILNLKDGEERLGMLAKHIRGYDNAMREVGDRFQIVYEALKLDNFDLAIYHWQKIKVTMEDGIYRRPKRAENTQKMFLNNIYEPVLNDFKSKDSKKAWDGFETAKANCMACHDAEKISFMNNQPLFINLKRPK